MKNLKVLLSLLVFLFFSGCVHFPRMSSAENTDPALKIQMQTRLDEAEKALEQQNYSQASELFSQFEKEYPHGMFLNRSKMGHGQALSGEGKNAEAAQIFHEVIDSSLGSQPEVVALASYYSSFCYEALGDEAKTYAALSDAKGLEAQLPPEVAKAQLPARLAAYYNRAGDLDTAKKYFHIAEKGISSAFRQDGNDVRSAKAKTLYLMGELSSNQLSIENMQSQMDTLALMQIFLMRAVEINDPQWSALALKNLQGNYKDLWNTIANIPKNKALDAFAAEQEQNEARVHSWGEILELIQRLKVYREAVTTPGNQFAHDLFAFLEQMETQAQEQLATAGTMPLTPEAQKRQSLHREGTIRDGSRTEAPHEDPNMQGH